MNQNTPDKKRTTLDYCLFSDVVPAKENQTFSEESMSDSLSPPQEISIGSDYTNDADYPFDEEELIPSMLNEDMRANESETDPLQTPEVALSTADEQSPETIRLNIEEPNIQMDNPGDLSREVENNTNFYSHEYPLFRNNYEQTTEELNNGFSLFVNNPTPDSNYPSCSLNNTKAPKSKKSLKLEGSYDNDTRKYKKGKTPKNWTSSWPKYIGSLVVDCLVIERKLLSEYEDIMMR